MDNKQTINVAISGMTCQACASRIEKVLNKKSSIKMASVNFAGESANITFDDSKTTIDEIIGWIKKAGFDAVLMQDSVSAAQVSAIPYSLLGLWALSLPFWVGCLAVMHLCHQFGCSLCWQHWCNLGLVGIFTKGHGQVLKAVLPIWMYWWHWQQL